MNQDKDELLTCRSSGPVTYIAWMNWAERRIKSGWKQLKCKKCKNFHVWVKPNQTVEKGR